MRGSRMVLLVLGALFLAGGAVLAAKGLSTDGPSDLGFKITGFTFVPMGIVFLVLSKYIAGLDNSATLKNGMPGTAQVLFTQDTGTVIGNVNLVVRVGLRVALPGRAPYDTETRWVARGRQQWSALQPGMTVAVMVDPNDPAKVAIDTSRPAVPVAPFGSPPMSTGYGQPQIVTRNAAEIIAAGVKVDGQLLQVVPTGMTAGQVMPGLPAHEADDPVVQVAFTYPGPGGAPQNQQTLVRVPDGKAAYLVAGRPIPVAVLATDLSSATIDWTRLP